MDFGLVGKIGRLWRRLLLAPPHYFLSSTLAPPHYYPLQCSFFCPSIFFVQSDQWQKSSTSRFIISFLEPAVCTVKNIPGLRPNKSSLSPLSGPSCTQCTPYSLCFQVLMLNAAFITSLPYCGDSSILSYKSDSSISIISPSVFDNIRNAKNVQCIL